MTQDWSQQRRANAEARARQLQNKQYAESVAAAEHIRAFVRAARATGLEPQPLRARNGDGTRTAKTPLTGWYIKADHSMAIDTDGNFYLLTAPLTLMDRMKGISPAATAPPLILGKGGRDGEQIDLVDALTNVIPNWRDHQG